MNSSPVCPVCGCSRANLRYSGKPVRREWQDENSFDVFNCDNCTHGFLYPVPDEKTLLGYYGRQYSAYQVAHGTGDLQAAIAQAQREKRFRHVDLDEALDVLDVGCGSGSFLRVIRDAVRSIQGVEPSAHGVATCQELGVPVFHGQMEAFVENNERSYDLITLNHVLEHHPYPCRLLELCRSCLKRSGTIWIAVPNSGCFLARSLKSEWHSSDLPVHIQHFSLVSIEKAIINSGLKIRSIYTRSDNSLPGSVSKLLRRFGLPMRISTPLLYYPLSGTSFIGRRIDDSGNGEAILVATTPS